MQTMSGTINDFTRPDAEPVTVAACDAKCTLYFKGGLGMVAVHCNRVEVKQGSYAQYAAALFVQFREKGKRKDRVLTQTSFPSVLIVEGHDAPEPDDGRVALESSQPGVSVSRSRYMSCDPRWQSDFDAMIDAEIAAGRVRVVFDGRKHNPHSRFPGL